MSQTDAPDVKHTLWDDIQGLSTGLFACSLGMQFLTTAGLLTGQTAGVAVILAYLTGISFGILFFVINLPFYFFAWQRMGREFTVKSMISVTVLSILTEIMPLGLAFSRLDPWMAALSFGMLVGTGLLVMFRHKGSLGGLGVVALYIQDSTGFKAGNVQLIFDVVLFAIAALLFPLETVAWSLLGAVVLNLIITFNHRRDRYIAT
ncbi:MAG: YitT family protein [Pseudomonadota bacterium]